MSGIKVEGAQTLFKICGIEITQTIISMTIVTLLLCIAGILMGRGLTKRPGRLQVITEKLVSMLRNLVVSTMGEHNIGWVPYIGTIFVSSIFGSLIGLTGFLRSTTADLSVVLTWAIMTSVIIWYQSIKRNGILGWLKGFTEPIVVMTPMNIISEVAQPFAMAFRHFGNVAGGSIISSIVYTALSLASAALIGFLTSASILPWIMIALGVAVLIIGFHMKKYLVKIVGVLVIAIGAVSLLEYFGVLSGVPILQIGIPAILSVYFDLFSGFVQAFVFSLLCMVYIAGVCPPPQNTENQK